MCGRVHAAGKGKHLRRSRWPWLAWLSLYINRSGEDHKCSDIGDSSSRLCGEVVFGGIAGGVVVESLGDTSQRLGMVEDTHRGTSSRAAIKRRRPQGVAGRAQRLRAALEDGTDGRTKLVQTDCHVAVSVRGCQGPLHNSRHVALLGATHAM